MKPPRARRLGWLGPAIVLVGAAAAGVASWYMVVARPEPGEVLDTVALGDGRAVVVRAEAGGPRAFVELHDGPALRWRALIPAYGGRPGAPGVAWSDIAVTVRVVRDGHAELFALALRDAAKLGGVHLATDRGPIDRAAPGPITLTDHQRSYELIAGAGWHELVAVDLHTGRPVWRQDLGPEPVRAGGVDADAVWIDQGHGRRAFAAASGQPRGATAQAPAREVP